MVTTYWQDVQSKSVVRFDTEWDAKEMKTNPEYKQVTEKEYKEFSTKPAKVKTKE